MLDEVTLIGIFTYNDEKLDSVWMSFLVKVSQSVVILQLQWCNIQSLLKK